MFVAATITNVTKGPAISAFRTKPIIMNPNILIMNRQDKPPIRQTAKTKRDAKKVRINCIRKRPEVVYKNKLLPKSNQKMLQ